MYIVIPQDSSEVLSCPDMQNMRLWVVTIIVEVKNILKLVFAIVFKAIVGVLINI